MSIDWIIIPAISALIGWGTNYIAVKMIFRPYNPVNILGITFHGLIPKRRADLAEKISETISDHLISHDDFLEKFKGLELENSFRTLMDSKLDSFINEKLFAFSPLIAGFLNNSIKEKIKGLLMTELMKILPELSESIIKGMEKSFDLKKIIVDRINAFEIQKFESIIMDISRRELKAIELLGGVLGLIIGFIQVLLLKIM